jgi:hypothetical protein
MCLYKYVVTAAMTVETDIIVRKEASPKERVVVLVIMYVEIFGIDVNVFIGNTIMYLRSH